MKKKDRAFIIDIYYVYDSISNKIKKGEELTFWELEFIHSFYNLIKTYENRLIPFNALNKTYEKK